MWTRSSYFQPHQHPMVQKCHVPLKYLSTSENILSITNTHKDRTSEYLPFWCSAAIFLHCSLSTSATAIRSDFHEGRPNLCVSWVCLIQCLIASAQQPIQSPGLFFLMISISDISSPREALSSSHLAASDWHSLSTTFQSFSSVGIVFEMILTNHSGWVWN